MTEFVLDQAHKNVDIFGSEVTQAIWREKYLMLQEGKPKDCFFRVANAVYANDKSEHMQEALKAMNAGLWMPGGRILAGAGSGRAVTLMNCYVDQTIHDSMGGIADALKDAMLTLQQGGGIGMDFSTLRPNGAILKRTGSTASGPLPFMDMWNYMSKTVMSAGHRRGAMMATMRCDHPDIEKFIDAKHEKGRLEFFNISVLVTKDFIQAVRDDKEWWLHFGERPAKPSGQIGMSPSMYRAHDGEEHYVYKVVRARELWNKILKSTFEYSEPGVIFIDRINEQNNLQYCETISCTNPCGEQPLPPNGACNLGAINLARMVFEPFTPKASFCLPLLKRVVRMAVRFLDNVIDVTNYPLEAQQREQMNKRRIGLGISGLGDVFLQLGTRYGYSRSIDLARAIMKTIAEEAYSESIELAKERGPFKLYDAEQHYRRPFIQKLDHRIVAGIKDHGIRNGVLLTIAPTGTTSIAYGNISSGLEPVFMMEHKRNVIQPDNSKKPYTVEDYAFKLFKQHDEGANTIPDLYNLFEESEAGKISVTSHLAIQAACQEYVDASVSKTINCPLDMDFKDFEQVYFIAYKTGCKGCTTYKPSEVRGAILEAIKPESSVPIEQVAAEAKKYGIHDLDNLDPDGSDHHILGHIEDKLQARLQPRPAVLSGKTYKVKWPNMEAAFYITINDDANGKPYEMFISSRSDIYKDWTAALTRMISAIMRSGLDVGFIIEELSQVSSIKDAAWVGPKYYGSIVAYIGHILDLHIKGGNPDAAKAAKIETHKPIESTEAVQRNEIRGDICPKCNAPTLIHQEGCTTCSNCGYSNCG